MLALVDAAAHGGIGARIAVVVSNRPDASGLERAREAGIEAVTINHRDRARAGALREREVHLVCLAGFMRLIGGPMLEAFPNAILNIHPSLLPAFPGTDAQAQAIAHGVKVSGVTVHLVTGELDGGPIVLQRAVPVRDDDTTQTLSARILVEEHQAYPEAVKIVLSGSCRLDGRRFLTT